MKCFSREFKASRVENRSGSYQLCSCVHVHVKSELTEFECYRTKFGHFSRSVRIILAVLTVYYSKTEHLLSLCIDLLICGLKKHERRFIKVDCQSCICFWMKTWTEMSLMLWCLYSMSGADEGPYLLDIHWLKAKLCLRCIPLDKPAIFPLDSSIEAGTAFSSWGQSNWKCCDNALGLLW